MRIIDVEWETIRDLLLDYCREIGCTCCTGISYQHNRYENLVFDVHQDEVRENSTGISFYDFDKLKMFFESLQ